jgi:hypothetical protein
MALARAERAIAMAMLRVMANNDDDNGNNNQDNDEDRGNNDNQDNRGDKDDDDNNEDDGDDDEDKDSAAVAAGGFVGNGRISGVDCGGVGGGGFGRWGVVTVVGLAVADGIGGTHIGQETNRWCL